MSSNETSLGGGLVRPSLQDPQMSSAVILLVLASLIAYLLSRPKKLNLPIMGKPNEKFYGDVLLEGVAKYPNTPFVIPVNPPVVILPLQTIDEIRNLPEEQVSFQKTIAQDFSVRHTGIGKKDSQLITAVKVDLTRNVAKTLGPLQDEVRYAFNKELGPGEDWTPVYMYSTMARIVALLSGRVFVGLSLSRNEDWLDASIKYTMDVIGARNALVKWPVYVRDIVAPFLPQVKGLKQYKARGGKLLEPVLKATLARSLEEKSKVNKSVDDEDEEEQGSFISWILQYTAQTKRADAVHLANSQMTLSFAAIHTSTMAATQAVYDLVSRPEYILPLRDEIQQVVDEDGQDIDSDGFLKLKKTSMPKLRKLDSFLKESQRLSPAGIISNTRLTTAPLTLSTGHTLPKNTKIAFPSHVVNTSAQTTTYSPTYNPSTAKPPSEFDGFRFSNLREMSGKENRHQFVTTSSDSLNFGHGNHACPGRFFASNEIKVVLIEMLRNWEFRLKGDEEMRGGEERRPKNGLDMFSVMPDTAAEIEFRRRK